MSEVRGLLSAYLDDELDGAERAEVDARLVESPELRTELAELAATRRLLRDLPPVTPSRPLSLPAGAATPRAHRRRRLGIALVGVAAIWLVVLSIGVGLGRLPVIPDVEQFSAQHATADPVGGFVPMESDDMDDPAVMDDIGHGMVRDGVFMRGDVVYTRYSDGSHVLSVFHQPGTVDWNAMPDMGTVEMMPEGPLWHGAVGGNEVMVTQRGDLVVTVVVGDDMDDDMAMQASMAVPEVDIDESLWSRLRSAPANLIDRIT